MKTIIILLAAISVLFGSCYRFQKDQVQKKVQDAESYANGLDQRIDTVTCDIVFGMNQKEYYKHMSYLVDLGIVEKRGRLHLFPMKMSGQMFEAEIMPEFYLDSLYKLWLNVEDMSYGFYNSMGILNLSTILVGSYTWESLYPFGIEHKYLEERCIEFFGGSNLHIILFEGSVSDYGIVFEDRQMVERFDSIKEAEKNEVWEQKRKYY